MHNNLCTSQMRLSHENLYPHVRWLIKILASSQNFHALLQHTPRVISVSNLVLTAGTRWKSSGLFIYSFYN